MNVLETREIQKLQELQEVRSITYCENNTPVFCCNHSKNDYFQKNNDNYNKDSAGVSVDFYGIDFNPYKENVPRYINQLRNRINKTGQFLNWVDLPQKQLTRINEFYSLAEQFKNNTGSKKLTVLGIGGSKHPIEHMLSINGLNLKNDINFYSDIDTLSLNRFITSLDDDITSSNFLVVSKSGSTFETKDGFLRIKNKLIEAYVNKGYSKEEAEVLSNKHFIAVTDSDGNKSQLRNTAEENNWIGNLKIHDDVGGRFSAFDDHVLFALAYAGMKQEDMRDMLKEAQKASEESLSYNLDKNMALKEAIFWVNAKNNGIENSVHQYFGSTFDNTIQWETQLHNESIKDTNKQVAKIPDAMHHSAEAHFNPENSYTYALTVTTDRGECSENTQNYIDALIKSYSEQGPFFVETLDSNDMSLTPEAAGRLAQMRAFSTIYEEIVAKTENGEALPEVLESVLQPNVETYKRNLKNLSAGRISN